MVSCLSNMKDSCLSYFKSGVVIGVSAITAVKTAEYLKSYICSEIIPGFVCESGLVGDNICRFGSIGQASIPCAERID